MDKCYGGFLFDELYEYEDAIQACNEILAQQPDNYVAYNNRGVMLWELGEDGEARADLISACELVKNDAEPHTNFGRFLESNGETEKALSAYREAIRRDRKNAISARCLGHLLINEGCFEEAIKALSLAIDQDDDPGATYYLRATAYEALGMLADAEKDREKIAALR